MLPAYNIMEFIKACGEPNMVIVHERALNGAGYFNIFQKERLLFFVSEDGLDCADFILKKPWENNPNKNVTIYVDSYNFFTGDKYGYIAFFKTPTGKWMIKSFKRNINPDPRNFAFAGLDKLLGMREVGE